MQVKKIHPDATFDRATIGSAGWDLSNVGPDVELAPRARHLFPTGIMVAVPLGWVGDICPRSGLSYKSGITVHNSPGTIDSDYRGEIGVILINDSDAPVTIAHKQRIAQMVIKRVLLTGVQFVDTLDETVRGEGGFGHTGT